MERVSSLDQQQFKFDGATYIKEFDQVRLSKQLQKVFDIMKDGNWRTLEGLSQLTGYPGRSISARLRDLRKTRFGGHIVERERKENGGTYQYRVIISKYIDKKQALLIEQASVIRRSNELVEDLSFHQLSSRTRALLKLEQLKCQKQLMLIMKILKK